MDIEGGSKAGRFVRYFLISSTLVGSGWAVSGRAQTRETMAFRSVGLAMTVPDELVFGPHEICAEVGDA